jgi:nickel/cobalt transporter (NicO) family protein
VAGGEHRAIIVATAAAILFGAVHALMPGHGKIVLISYHLGRPSSPMTAFANGALLALTHVGLAAALVIAGYAVISRAFAYGGRTPQFEAASGVLITLIGACLLWTSLTHRHDAAPKGRLLALATGMIPCPLTTFVLSYALARGVLASGLLVTAAMTVGMIATIGGAFRPSGLDELHHARADRTSVVGRSSIDCATSRCLIWRSTASCEVATS